MVRQKAPKAGTSTKLEGNRRSSSFSRSRVVGFRWGEVSQRVVLGILVGRLTAVKWTPFWQEINLALLISWVWWIEMVLSVFLVTIFDQMDPIAKLDRACLVPWFLCIKFYSNVSLNSLLLAVLHFHVSVTKIAAHCKSKPPNGQPVVVDSLGLVG